MTIKPERRSAGDTRSSFEVVVYVVVGSGLLAVLAFIVIGALWPAVSSAASAGVAAAATIVSSALAVLGARRHGSPRDPDE